MAKQSARKQHRQANIKPGTHRYTSRKTGNKHVVLDGQDIKLIRDATPPQITPGYLPIKEVARRYAAFVSGTGSEAQVLAILELRALIESVKSGQVQAMHRNWLTPVHTDAPGANDDYLTECRLSLDAARRYLIEHGALSEDAVQQILADDSQTTEQADAEQEKAATQEPPAHAAPPTDTDPTIERRKNHDITAERGCRRSILELWDEIQNLYGPNADGRQVLIRIKHHPEQPETTLKTVQNRLGELRKEKLIP